MTECMPQDLYPSPDSVYSLYPQPEEEADTFFVGTASTCTTTTTLSTSQPFRAELPIYDCPPPASSRGVKRPACQITTVTHDGKDGFRNHCERLLRYEHDDKRLKTFHDFGDCSPAIRLSFDELPCILFDSSSIAMRKFLIFDEPNSDSDSQSSNDTDRPWSGIFILVAAVNVLEAKFVEIEPRTLYYNDYLTFGDELYKLLPPHKCFFLWFQVFNLKGTLITEAVTHPIILLHDGLKDSPPTITADVCFFPQKVVIDHLNNCNSKATLSKRHKKGKLKEGAKWCRNPSCGAKATCSCQAYPSRILKKYIRETKDLLERERSSSAVEVAKAAQDLYTTLNITADQQTKKLPTYESFLQERIRRWQLFLRLKEFAASPLASVELRDKLEALTNLLPPL